MNLFFVANFRTGFVEKYDANWNLVSQFTDTSLNNIGYSPFNPYVRGNHIYMSYMPNEIILIMMTSKD